MDDESTRSAALAQLTQRSLRATSRTTGISRSTLRARRDGAAPPVASQCPRCTDTPLTEVAYAALLGFYLGDGCVSRNRGYFSLRVSCDASYGAIVSDVVDLIEAVRPGRAVFRVRAPGAVVVQSN